MRFFIIAGEASGDMHGANLVEQIKRVSPDSTFEGFGGKRLEQQGMKLLQGLEKLNFMGLIEVIKNYPTIRESFKICKDALSKNPPDALILIDYPGFNLRMAKWAKKREIKVFYYISPQVWAWKEGRVRQMKKNIDRLMVILPFEKEFFAKHGMDVDFVGHPLIDEIEKRQQATTTTRENIVALLPGSREQEIRHILPEMLKVREQFPKHRFLIGKAPNLDNDFYEKKFDLSSEDVFDGKTYDLLSRSKAALVASGTATLETALLKVPQVVCYKADGLFVSIVRKIIKVKYISLVNLILDRPAVKELIQEDLNTASITEELNQLLTEGETKNQMLADYSELWDKLGSGGASERAAKLIVEDLSQN